MKRNKILFLFFGLICLESAYTQGMNMSTYISPLKWLKKFFLNLQPHTKIKAKVKYTVFVEPSYNAWNNGCYAMTITG